MRRVLPPEINASVAVNSCRIDALSWKATTAFIQKGALDVPKIKASDSTEIFYNDWGKCPVLTFSHGWPLCVDAWDPQMLFLVQHGYRCIAHDRRGALSINPI